MLFNIISHKGNANLNHDEIPYISVRRAKMKNTDNTKCSQGHGATGTVTLLMGM